LYLLKELVQAFIVAAYSIVVVITTELGIQQSELFPHPAMAIPLAPLGYPLD
jgi:hypothetical protein